MEGDLTQHAQIKDPFRAYSAGRMKPWELYLSVSESLLEGWGSRVATSTNMGQAV